MELRKYLPLNLQFFAEESDEETKAEVIDEPTTTEESENNTDQDVRTFTQAELDKIIADRLAREQKKRDQAIQKERDEAERKKLEEQEEYKGLAQKYREELDAIKAEALTTKKDALLAKAGYTDEQAERYRKYLDGETDEELAQALDQLKSDIPPKKSYVDPSAGNGGKDKPKPGNNDLYDSARERARNILKRK